MRTALTIQEYTEALERKKLLGLKCEDCGTITAPPRMTCSNCCGFHLKPIELSRNGKIATYTIIRVPPQSRQGQQPYFIVLVELDEGPWIMANLAGAEVYSASLDLIGKKVRLIASLPSPERRSEGGLAPLFELCDSD